MCLWCWVGTSHSIRTSTCKSDPPSSLQRHSFQVLEDQIPTSQAPSSRSQTQAWEAAGSWNFPLLAACPRVPRQSWQWAQAPPGRGSLLSLLYHFVPSVQHLPPVLWREGARRGIVRVCDACILRRCVHICTCGCVCLHECNLCSATCRLGNLSSES